MHALGAITQPCSEWFGSTQATPTYRTPKLGKFDARVVCARVHLLVRCIPRGIHRRTSSRGCGEFSNPAQRVCECAICAIYVPPAPAL